MPAKRPTLVVFVGAGSVGKEIGERMTGYLAERDIHSYKRTDHHRLGGEYGRTTVSIYLPPKTTQRKMMNYILKHWEDIREWNDPRGRLPRRSRSRYLGRCR